MTSPALDPFDFSPDKARHVRDGVDILTLAPGVTAYPVGSRKRAIEALEAVRLYLQGQPVDARCGEALAALAREVKQVEYALRDLEAGCKPEGLVAPNIMNRPPVKSIVREFQLRAVFAVKWLQDLSNHSLSKDEAVRDVSSLIPEEWCSWRKHVRLSSPDQLKAWEDAYRRILGGRRVELEDIGRKWDAVWRDGKFELVPLRAGGVLLDEAHGPRDRRDATPEIIRNWLRAKRDEAQGFK